MPIFKVQSGKLKKLNIISLDKERNLQALLESNLMEALELRFLATEFVTTAGGRIDSVAIDASGAPVIIEYKRNRNDNVINQALSYLKWLKTQKSAFFEKLVQDKLGRAVADQIKLDWNNPRVICIAESYSKFDIDTVEVVPLRIELFKYRYYEGDIFGLERVNVGDQIEQIEAAKPVRDSSEAPKASVDALRAKGTEPVRLLFDALRERILVLDENVEEKATQLYVAFRASGNFAEVYIGKNQLKIHLRPIDYEDPKGKVEKIPEGYNWTMDRRLYLSSADELDYVLGIIEQSYKNVL